MAHKIPTNISRRVAIPLWPGFCVCWCLCFVFSFVCLLLFWFKFWLFVLCFAHEAWKCSLDYVQVRNRPLLKLVYFDGHGGEFTNSVSGNTNLLNDLRFFMTETGLLPYAGQCR